MPYEPNPVTRRLTAWTRSLALVLGLAGTGAAALAQDVELYDRPDFRGTRLTLDTAAADLSSYGLGGGVSSLVVTRGQWEFCTQPQYRGACVTLGPGRYERLPPSLNDRLASLRPVADMTPPPPQARPYRPLPPGMPAIVLVAGDLSGEERLVTDAIEDLRSQGFNDSTSHVDVRAGRWELCPDGGYQGACLVFGPGRHVLPPELRNRLSSLRPVGPGRGGLPAPLPDPIRPAPGMADLVLFEHPDFSGRRLALDRAAPNLAPLGFNDQASAVEIRRGRWQLCRHADYGGECVVLGPGRYALGQSMQDEVSSVRPLVGNGGPAPGPALAVTLYDGPDGRGRSVVVERPVDNLRDLRFNDRALSVEVHGGRWELCSAAGFRGRCEVFGPGRHRLPNGLAGELSSLRPR